MRFLGIGDDASLGDMYIRLGQADHDVRVHVDDPAAHDVLNGLITRTSNWKNELDWIKSAGADGIIVFENAHLGRIQDELRQAGYNVIGGSAFGDRLESDRSFGQRCMREAGLPTAATHNFTDFRAAIAFIKEHPRRYVFKLNGSGFASGRNTVGELDDGRDIQAILQRYLTTWRFAELPDFILMDHIVGVEVGVGAYFNGEEFLEPVVIDWEHKRFFNDDLGELTGEMGTLASYRNSRPIFEATLAKMREQLARGKYVGYINVNTIVNDEGIWPLEFTCRFGYPGFVICDALHAEGWDVLFRRMIARDRLDFRTHPGFAVGVLLTVPPFPRSDRYMDLSKGLPVLFRTPPTPEDRLHLHLCEIEMRDGQWLTAGEVGALLVATGRGDTVEAARDAAYKRARNIVVPGVRYRTDIGARFLARERADMQRLGLWPMV